MQEIFFRSPVAVGLFLREHGLQGIFFSKKPTPALNDQMVGPQVTNVLLRQLPRFASY